MTSAAVRMDHTGRFSEGFSQIHQTMGYQFEDVMFQWQTQLPELSDIDTIPDHMNSIGLHMLDDLPELRDDISPIFEPVSNTSFSANDLSSFSSPASIYNNTYNTYNTYNTNNTCDEIENAEVSNTTTPASYHRSFMNLLHSVPAPPKSFNSEPPTSCDPNFSPSISTQAMMQSHSSLQPPTETSFKGRRARKLCTGEEMEMVGVRKANSKKAKVAVVTTDSGVEKSKQFRAPTKAEHIVRERQRRDDMAVKYNILESLLPSAAKRERAVIVEDAMMFVKDLQHRKEELLKRRSQMRIRARSSPPPPPPPPQQQKQPQPQQHQQGVDGKCKVKIANQNEDTGTRVRVASGQQTIKACETGSPLSASSSEDLVTTSIHQTAIKGTNPTLSISKIINPAGSYVRKLQVHGSLLDDEEIQIEVLCSQPRPDFQSLLIQSMELLSLEIRYCSFSRLQPERFVQCIVTAKPLHTEARSKIQSSASIIHALQAALEHVQH